MSDEEEGVTLSLSDTIVDLIRDADRGKGTSKEVAAAMNARIKEAARRQ